VNFYPVLHALILGLEISSKKLFIKNVLEKYGFLIPRKMSMLSPPAFSG
jgi:hypothetical protein